MFQDFYAHAEEAMRSAYWNEDRRLKDLFKFYTYIVKLKWTVFSCTNILNPNIFRIVIQSPKYNETQEIFLYPAIRREPNEQ